VLWLFLAFQATCERHLVITDVHTGDPDLDVSTVISGTAWANAGRRSSGTGQPSIDRWEPLLSWVSPHQLPTSASAGRPTCVRGARHHPGLPPGGDQRISVIHGAHVKRLAPLDDGGEDFIWYRKGQGRWSTSTSFGQHLSAGHYFVRTPCHAHFSGMVGGPCRRDVDSRGTAM
jgi:hypothetical protein